MKKLLYIVLLYFVLIGCTSNENDVLDNARTYNVNDLVEIASEYGIIFQPQKDAVNIRFSQKEIDSFRVHLNSLKGLKGRHCFDRCANPLYKTVSEKYSRSFSERSNMDSVYSDSYDFKTSYYNSYYACDCTSRMVYYIR